MKVSAKASLGVKVSAKASLGMKVSAKALLGVKVSAKASLGMKVSAQASLGMKVSGGRQATKARRGQTKPVGCCSHWCWLAHICLLEAIHMIKCTPVLAIEQSATYKISHWICLNLRRVCVPTTNTLFGA